MPQSPADTRASLILRLQNTEDEQAWEEFLEIYSPVVRRVAGNRGLQPTDADNLAQEVMLKVAQSVSRWLERDDRGSFRAWLRRIAHHEAIDLLTSRATRPLDGGAGVDQTALEDLAVTGEISSMIELEYERALFQWAAERVRRSVTEPTWRAFWLTHVEGHSISEAAQQLGVREAKIYFSRSRVMARIRELVQKHEGTQ